MSVAVVYDVQYTEPRNRLTTAFRVILAIPHLVCVALWGYVVELASVIQWLIILFTGRRNEGIWRFTRGYISYSGRTNGYLGLLFDEYPGFFNEWKNEPVAFDLRDDEPPNRLTNALRIIWIIPALIVGMFIQIGAAVVSLIAWFAILFTGAYPRGMFDFAVRAMRMSVRLNAYGFLATDAYPMYNGSEPVGTEPPGDHSLGAGSGTGYSSSSPLPPPPPPG
jgi:hypothetical protein